VDRKLDDAVETVKELVDLGLKGLLVISGDNPMEAGYKTYKITSINLIERLKKEFQNLKVYAGFDQYRTSFAEELAYTQQKLKAGADGVFTQPFFDEDLARVYLEQLESTEVFVGLCPVITNSAKEYWRHKNKAVFPKRFELDFKYNCRKAQAVIKVTNGFFQNTYLMPILVNAPKYVQGVFG
jgi:methylenetetrahydrofolate reductase (NADPH)